MRYVFYVHSLVSDWNHGNAHFLRGVVRELLRRGNEVAVLEPADGWSRANLVAEEGEPALAEFARRFPELSSRLYGAAYDPAEDVAEADVVLVHEWSPPELVRRLGRLRANGGRFTLLFHDTHHRAVSAADDIAALDLDGYDGVLAFGEALRQRYLDAGWGRQVFTWHEAADTELFRPLPEVARISDLIWIGNWGDGERSTELADYLFEPARRLGLSGSVYGVRYPDHALAAVEAAGLDYRGRIANAEAPWAFASHRATVHVPRRPYVEALPGIPTIRVFEALACGIPLVCAPWDDCEGLFSPGTDYLVAGDGEAMRRQLRAILADADLAAALSASGCETIRRRHTCSHRIDELQAILQDLSQAQAGAGIGEAAE